MSGESFPWIEGNLEIDESVMDEIVHRSVDGGNELIMTKRGVIGDGQSSAGERDS